MSFKRVHWLLYLFNTIGESAYFGASYLATSVLQSLETGFYRGVFSPAFSTVSEHFFPSRPKADSDRELTHPPPPEGFVKFRRNLIPHYGAYNKHVRPTGMLIKTIEFANLIVHRIIETRRIVFTVDNPLLKGGIKLAPVDRRGSAAHSYNHLDGYLLRFWTRIFIPL